MWFFDLIFKIILPEYLFCTILTRGRAPLSSTFLTRQRFVCESFYPSGQQKFTYAATPPHTGQYPYTERPQWCLSIEWMPLVSVFKMVGVKLALQPLLHSFVPICSLRSLNESSYFCGKHRSGNWHFAESRVGWSEPCRDGRLENVELASIWPAQVVVHHGSTSVQIDSGTTHPDPCVRHQPPPVSDRKSVV